VARDPFEEAIVQRLEGKLDPAIFEACACDLLRDAFPTLAPLPGGSDTGMDGVTAGDGPFLVATTEQQPLRNLTRSLESHLAHGGERRRIVFATTRALTTDQDRKLRQKAKELGFAVEAIYQQQAFVDRLYHQPRWCKKLLELAGDPPALALVPSGHRPLIEGALVGQEEASEWLRSTPGDRVLSGPPGSGKTYLLFHLARQDFGLFLESDDPGRIAEDLRRLQPKVVVVDDAHVRLGRLRALRDLRKQNAAFEFEIVAITWEGEDRQSVLAELTLPGDCAFSLPLLPREQILEIVRQVGIEGPPRLIQEILDQARNRPGLAVTLAYLALRGGWHDVATGTALSRTLLNQLKERLGPEAVDVLAVLALGGRTGMTMQAVGAFLGLSVSAVRHVLALLATAGVIEPVKDRMVVRPTALRFSLVRDRFFQEGQPNFDFRRLVPEAPDPQEQDPAVDFEGSLLTILGAAHRGGRVPREDLERRLLATSSARAWDAYAALGAHEAAWATEHYPDITQIAWGGLAGNAPATIRRLLDAAARDRRNLDSHPEQPLRILRDWLGDIELAQHRPDRWIARRKLAAEVIREWARQDGDPSTALAALCLALSPAISGTSSDPVKGMTVTISQGVASSSELAEVEKLWPLLLDFVTATESVQWAPLGQLLHGWVYPEMATMGAKVSDATRALMKAFAKRMIEDLALRFSKQIGIGRRLQEYAAVLGVKIAIQQEPLFDLLCPWERDWTETNWKERSHQQGERVKQAAEEWAQHNPLEMAQDLVAVARHAKQGGLHLDSWRYTFCNALAEHTKHPLAAYVTALLDLEADPQIVGIFMYRLAAAEGPEALQLATRCLRSNAYDHIGFTSIITHSESPPDLLEEALAKADQYTASIEGACMRREVSVDTLRSLLDHPHPAVGLAAAAGEWHGGTRGEVRDEIRAEWRAAILRAPIRDDASSLRGGGQNWELGEILASDPQLAQEWLTKELTHPRGHWYWGIDPHAPAMRALAGLGTEQRIALLELIPNSWSWEDFTAALVGRDLEAYKALLANPSKQELWLAPLRGGAEEGWANKARLAALAGLSANDIAHEALFGGGWTIMGSGIEHWQEELGKIERAAADHPELAPLVTAAREQVAPMIDKARREEQQIDMFGLHGDD
jgi:hypothetical protein